MLLQTTKWRTTKEIAREAFISVRGHWKEDNMDFTIGSDSDASMLFIKMFNFPGGYLKPGEGVQFCLEIDEEGVISTDAWHYINTHTGEFISDYAPAKKNADMSS